MNQKAAPPFPHWEWSTEATGDSDGSAALESALPPFAVRENLRALYFSTLSESPDLLPTDSLLVRLVLDEARRTLKHLSRPYQKHVESFETHPLDEISLEDSFELNPFLDSASALRVTTSVPKEWSCVVMVDCSSSMSGEKHLLASIAVAVALLQVPPRDVSVVVFHSSALVVKKMGEATLAEKSVLDFLRSRPKGFTNIALGLTRGIEQASLSAKRRVGLIATDGRHTEGKDPNDVARGFDFLAVLHLHGPGSSLEASQALATAGHGICLEVETFSHLPNQLNQALKRMSRL